MTQKNYELFLQYDNDMVISSISENTRYKNLNHYGLLTKILQKDWLDLTENDIRRLVPNIMIKHGENGKETGYTFVLKMSVRSIVRFDKLGSRNKPEDGELSILKFIKSKKPKDKLTREDLPTDEEVSKILSACADSSLDKAMISVHAEAGTRIGELLGMKIKDFTIDKNGGMIKVAINDEGVKEQTKYLSDDWEIFKNIFIMRHKIAHTVIQPRTKTIDYIEPLAELMHIFITSTIMLKLMVQGFRTGDLKNDQQVTRFLHKKFEEYKPKKS